MAINLRCSIIEQKLTGSNMVAMAPVAHRKIGAWSKSIFMKYRITAAAVGRVSP
ncbi:hypothetical protein [Azotobacter chroococcum]|uniref:hypothetical protein n=1 Tax=Azotobacter chroococcum TaxID=353 RepID=UPI0013F15612|nr:hypothetical protein [Azotobacter chroococcum]